MAGMRRARPLLLVAMLVTSGGAALGVTSCDDGQGSGTVAIQLSVTGQGSVGDVTPASAQLGPGANAGVRCHPPPELPDGNEYMPPGCTFFAATGAEVTLVGTADPGWRFVSWTVDARIVENRSDTPRITVIGDLRGRTYTIAALFVRAGSGAGADAGSK